MKLSWILAGVLFSGAASAQCFGPGGCQCPPGQTWDDCSGVWIGPAPCVPGCRGALPQPPPSPQPPAESPTVPSEVCFGAAGCFPVRYFDDGGILLGEFGVSTGQPLRCTFLARCAPKD